MHITMNSGHPGDMTGKSARPRPSRAIGARPGRTPARALFRKLLAFNALVFVVGTAVLMISPATISAPISLTEAGVLAAGSALMLAANAWLLRATLKPLDGLTVLMRRVDLLRPGQRLTESGERDVTELVHTFNDMLDRLEHERSASSANALAVQEGERQRIARELHDEVGQSLTAVLLGMRRTIDRAPAGLYDELVSLQEMVRSCLDEVRMVARRLRPGVLEDLGLLSAMQALAADFTAASGVPVRVSVDEQLPPLNANSELVLYRIAQEGLTNIARHAAASQVDLDLRADGGEVRLTIQDDGIGFRDAEEGTGIRGMRERSLLVGADLCIEGTVPSGTRLQLSLPQRAAAARPSGENESAALAAAMVGRP